MNHDDVTLSVVCTFYSVLGLKIKIHITYIIFQKREKLSFKHKIFTFRKKKFKKPSSD